MAKSFLKALKSKKKAKSPSEQKDTSTSSPKIGGHRPTPPLPGPSKPVPLPVIGGHRRKSSSPSEQKDRSTAPQIGGHRAKGSSSTGVAPIAEMQKWNATKAKGGSERGAPMIGRGRGLGVSRVGSAPTPSPSPQTDDEKSPYTANYNYGSVDAIKFSPEDDKDTGPYNNAGYGNTSSIKFEEEKDDNPNTYNPNTYNDAAYSVTSFDDGKAKLVEEEVKDTVEAQKAEVPSPQSKAGKGGPAKEVPAVRKHRAWLVSKLGETYAEERTTQRTDLVGAIGALGAEIATYYVALREMQKLSPGDTDEMKGILKAFTPGHAIHQAEDVETALKHLEQFHAVTLEKARRQDLPITEDGQVGDVSSRLVDYDDEAAQQRSLVLVGGQKLHRNDDKKSLVDTKAGVTHFTGVGAEIFVVGMNNEIHMASHKIGKFHHSSLLGGQPVSMAGEIKATAGNIDWISNKSGHYKPTSAQLQQFLHHLGKDISLDFPIKGMNVPEGTTARQLVDGVNARGEAKEKFGHNVRKTEELLLAWIDLLGKDEVSDVMELNDWVLEEIDDDEYEVVDVNDEEVAPEKVRRALKAAHPGKDVKAIA